MVVKGRGDSAEWFFVEAINLGEGWIEADSVDSIPEGDIPKLPILTVTPLPTSGNPAPNPTPDETAMKRGEKIEGKLTKGDPLRIPLDIANDSSFDVTILFEPSSKDVTLSSIEDVSLKVIENGEDDDPFGNESFDPESIPHGNIGKLTWNSTSLTIESEYEFIFTNNSDNDIYYCLMTYSAEDWCK